MCILKKISLFVCMFITSYLWAIKLPCGTDAMIGSFEKYKNGKFKSVELIEPVEIETSIGLLTFKDTINFYENGKIETGILANKFNLNTSFGSFLIYKVSFYQNATLESFNYIYKDQDAKIKTILGEIEYTDLYENCVKLHENGNIKSFYTNNFIISKDCSYNNGIFQGLKITDLISFYEDGSVESIFIPVYQGRKNAQSINTPYGKLQLEDSGHGSVLCELKLYNNGNIKYINLQYNKNMLITKNLGKIAVNLKVEFWENGNIKYADLANNQSFEIKDEIFSCSSISCYENGKIKAINNGDLVLWENENIKLNAFDDKEKEEELFNSLLKDFFEAFKFKIRTAHFDKTGKKIIGLGVACESLYTYETYILYFMVDDNFKFIGLGELDKETFDLKQSKEKLEETLEKLKY